MPPKGKKAKSSDDALAKKSKDLILLPSYHRRLATADELRDNISKGLAMGDARLGAMREAEDAVRAMHEYGLDASYSIRQRLMTILNEGQDVEHHIQDIRDVPKPEDHARLLEFLHTKSVPDARTALYYHSLYTAAEPIDMLRPSLSRVLLQIRLDTPARPEVEARLKTALARPDVLSVCRLLGKWIHSLTEFIRDILKELRDAISMVTSYVEGIRKDHDMLKASKPKELKQWMNEDDELRAGILSGMVRDLFNDTLPLDFPNKSDSDDENDSNDSDDDDANLETTEYMRGWKIAKAFVHYIMSMEFDTSFQKMEKAVSKLETAIP